MFRISIADKFCDSGFILLALVILLSTSFRGSLLIVSFIDEFLPRYMYISSNDKVVRAKKGTGGLHLVKTVKTWSPSSFPSSPPYPEHPHSHHHHEPQSRCKRSSSPRTQSPSPLSSAPSSRKSSATISSQLDIEHFFCTFFANFWCSAFGPFSQICRYWIHWSYLFSISFIIDSSWISGGFMEEICLVSRATKKLLSWCLLTFELYNWSHLKNTVLRICFWEIQQSIFFCEFVAKSQKSPFLQWAYFD